MAATAVHHLKSIADRPRNVGERLVLEDICALGYELSAQLAPFTVLGIFASLGMAFAAMDPTVDRDSLNKIVGTTPQLCNNLVGRPLELGPICPHAVPSVTGLALGPECRGDGGAETLFGVPRSGS
jgi:hypothetical protein